MNPHGIVNRKNSGFLLLEAMIASVILAVAAVGIVSLLLAAREQQIAMREQSTAVLLAKQLMEEIAAKPFGTATPAEPRAQITMANQYNGYTDTTAGITTLGNGESISPGDGQLYTRKVTVTSATNPTGSTAPTGDLQLLTVTVTTPSKQSVTLTRLLTNVTWP
jgi:Tfp pilus assembly protein PilV